MPTDYIKKYPMILADGYHLSPFGRLRVDNAHLVHSGAQPVNNLPLLFSEDITTGSGTPVATYSADRASVVMTVDDTTDEIIRQSKSPLIYRAGQGQKVHLSFADFASETGVTKEVGFNDANNGIFLQSTPTAINIVRRSSVTGSPVDETVASADWNGELRVGDVDWSKTQLLTIDMQALYVGRVRVFLDVDAEPVLLHEFKHTNTLSSVYISNANLPVRYRIVSSGGAGSLEHICSSGAREGGDEDTGFPVFAETFNDTKTATTTRRSLLALRIKSAYVGKALIRPSEISIMNRGTDDIFFAVYLNPTLGGALTYGVDVGTICEQSSTQQDYTSGGTVIAAGFVAGGTGAAHNSGGGSFLTSIPVAGAIDGTADQLVVCVESDAGTPAVDAVISGVEVY